MMKLKTKPYKHQVEALKRCVGKEYFALLMQQGTGKTWVTIARALYEWERGRIDSLVVLAPKGVYLNWLGELELHLPEDVHENMEICWWSSYRTKAVIDGLTRQLEPVEQDGELKPLRVMLMNIEALSTKKSGSKRLKDKDKLTAYEYLEDYLQANKCLLVVDESTTIKDKGSTRTKQLMQLRNFAAYRMILSGMPVPKAPTDLFSQCLFLKRGCIPYTSMVTFEAEFSIKERKTFGPRSFMQTVGYKNLDYLQDLLKPFTFRVTKKECLDLPDKIYQVQYIELTDEQKKLYNQLAKTFRAETEDGQVTTTLHAMTRVMRLHQIVCGHIPSDDPDRVISDIKSNRFEALLETLARHDGQAIVWASYRRDFEKLATGLRAAGLRVSEYWGGVDQDEREAGEKLFKAGKTDVMLANPGVGGRGRTWTMASLAVYYSNVYNYEFREQSEDRNHRIGTHESPLYVDFIVKGTVDEDIVMNLRDKKRNGGRLMGDNPNEFMNWFKEIS